MTRRRRRRPAWCSRWAAVCGALPLADGDASAVTFEAAAVEEASAVAAVAAMGIAWGKAAMVP